MGTRANQPNPSHHMKTTMSQGETVSHTPGPWEILKQNHNLYIGHKTPNEFTTSGFTWRFVGRPMPEQKSGAKRGCSPNWYGWSPLVEANARLIAAAPDLLEACKVVQPHLAEYVQWHHKFDGGCSVEMENALDVINAAITKATTQKEGAK